MITPTNGAHKNHILAQVTHEKTQIRCLSGGTNSAVDAIRTDWVHVVAIFGIIAVVMAKNMRTGSGTMRLNGNLVNSCYGMVVKVWILTCIRYEETNP